MMLGFAIGDVIGKRLGESLNSTCGVICMFSMFSGVSCWVSLVIKRSEGALKNRSTQPTGYHVLSDDDSNITLI